ncbi:MAG: 3-deoxy-manno-octulosonate cytidylyltransferase [Planctomycetes bacterium]|nr:3-deoxy-manno-octulosonate cytidylyltransferase [Planctomycetota bacterium]
MATVAVIPARYASSRFPGKPLARQTGKYLIQHVYESVGRCGKIDRVIVATDDQRIVEAVESFKGEAQLTRADHRSGTARVGEVAAKLSLQDDDLIINVQGDEPEIATEALDGLITRMREKGDSCGIGTLAAPFDDSGPRAGPSSPRDPNCVKVVVDVNGQALYFSRSPIPYLRATNGEVDCPSRWLLHLGVYAFRANVLRELTSNDGGPPSPLEEAESLEQLRWLEYGFPVIVVRVGHPFVGIDTPEDYAAFVERAATGAKRVGQGQSKAP